MRGLHSDDMLQLTVIPNQAHPRVTAEQQHEQLQCIVIQYDETRVALHDVNNADLAYSSIF
jgi:hypothetical protein